MEPSAVIELLGMEVEQIDSTMEFWLAASFAVILASHFARATLDMKLKIVMSLLYILVTAIAVFRILGDLEQLVFLSRFLQEAGVELPRSYSQIAMQLRFVLYGFGTVATLAYVFFSGTTQNDGEA